MISVFSVKPMTGNPADGIDNVNTAVFSRLDAKEIVFLAETPSTFEERGSIRIMDLKHKNSLLRFLEKLSIMRKLKPDWLFGIGGVADLPFILLKPRQTKYVVDWHTVLFKESDSWRVRTPWWLRKLIFNKADLVIAVSEFSAGSVRRYFPYKKVVSILNGVDLDFFSPGRKDEGYLAKKYDANFSKPIVVFIGALSPRKRPHLFVELAKRLPAANFVAVGREAPPHDFLADAKKLKNFKWIEVMPREDIAALLASSKIFVFPSLNDASAAVILEAMASGCAPIISKSGGNPEFVNDSESGFSIDVSKGEIDAFLEKMELLLKNKELAARMSGVARHEAELRSWDVVAVEYLKVLKENL